MATINAIGSPTKRTSSIESGNIGAMNSSAPWNIDGYIETATRGFSSAPVSTATTPGSSRAAVTSRRVIFARARSLRTKCACNMRGSSTSSV